MKRTKVEYSATINKGNYENEKITLAAELEEGEDAQIVIAILREEVLSATGERRSWSKTSSRYGTGGMGEDGL